jgi:hypothetical protein
MFCSAGWAAQAREGCGGQSWVGDAQFYPFEACCIAVKNGVIARDFWLTCCITKRTTSRWVRPAHAR